MKNYLLPVLSFLFLVGCGTTEPALTVSESDLLESHPVKGRQGLLINQKLKFAEFQTSRVKRSWTRGGNTRLSVFTGHVEDVRYPDLISLNYVDKDQAYFFQMNDLHRNFSDVYATSEFHSRDLQIGGDPNTVINILEDFFGGNGYADNLFYLQMFINEEERPWQLILDNEAAQRSPREYSGVFALDEEEFYTLRPVFHVMGKKGPVKLLAGSVGYEIFDRKENAVAAVSLIDGGNVYFHTKDPGERFLMANLCAALLLQENIAEY